MTGFEPLYYDFSGQPCDLDTWVALMADPRRIVVQQETTDLSGRSVNVSCVWLGLDFRWGSGGPPLIYELMIFGGDFDGELDRYATWQEARDGHAAWMTRIENGAALGAHYDTEAESDES